jgi:hypothetical protein
MTFEALLFLVCLLISSLNTCCGSLRRCCSFESQPTEPVHTRELPRTLFLRLSEKSLTGPRRSSTNGGTDPPRPISPSV